MPYITYSYNGKTTSFETKDEFVIFKRGFGEIQTEDELISYAEKITYNWYNAGWHHSFITYYISDYVLSDLYQGLTNREFKWLKEIQKRKQKEAKEADEARCWKLVDRIYWADNSTEAIYEDKNGVRKTEMEVAPHGDVC